MHELTFAYSPCPNDTYAFHALAHGFTEAPFRIRPVLLDIEELNRRAIAGEFHLTKLSVGAFASVGDRYRLLRSGAALGHGVGPLVVARTAMTLSEAALGKIAIPGTETTAYRLLRLAAGQIRPLGFGAQEEPALPVAGASAGSVPSAPVVPARPRAGFVAQALPSLVEMRYDRIMKAVARGDVDAGLVIHESRFTYADHGLVKVIDLGDWWEKQTGLPVPLAGICARADLDDDLRMAVERAIRASVQYAFDHPEASREYVRAHAQEMSDEVCAQHIALYVNQHSLDIGDDGLRAIARLVEAR